MISVDITLIFVYMAVLLLKSCDISSEACVDYGFGDSGKGGGLQSVSHTASSASSKAPRAPSLFAGLFLFFVFFGLGMLILNLLCWAVALTHSATAPTIKLALTGREPDLPLPYECEYHGFMSHGDRFAQSRIVWCLDICSV